MIHALGVKKTNVRAQAEIARDLFPDKMKGVVRKPHIGPAAGNDIDITRRIEVCFATMLNNSHVALVGEKAKLTIRMAAIRSRQCADQRQREEKVTGIHRPVITISEAVRQHILSIVRFHFFFSEKSLPKERIGLHSVSDGRNYGAEREKNGPFHSSTLALKRRLPLGCRARCLLDERFVLLFCAISIAGCMDLEQGHHCWPLHHFRTRHLFRFRLVHDDFQGPANAARQEA